jgi:virginiamycin B lyase
MTEFPISGTSGGDGSSVGIVTGPDGCLWFIENGCVANDCVGTKLGRITPAGQLMEFATRTKGRPSGIAVGPDGNLWITESSDGYDPITTVAKVDLGGHFTEYSSTEYIGATPASIVLGPDRNLWFALQGGSAGQICGFSAIGRATASGVVTSYPLPGGAPLPLVNFKLIGPLIVSSGGLLFAQTASCALGEGPRGLWRLDTSGQFSRWIAIDALIAGMAAAPDGTVWLTSPSAPALNAIGRVTPAGDVAWFPLPTAGGAPSAIVAGNDGDAWFTEWQGNKIGHIGSDGTFTEFAIPTPDSHPWTLTIGPDGNVWFVETFKVGRLTPPKAEGAAIPLLSAPAMAALAIVLACIGALIAFHRAPCRHA